MSVVYNGNIPPNLSKNELHIWKIANHDYFHDVNSFVNILSFEEIERAKNYAFPKHSHHFVIRSAILRIVLSFYLGIEPKRISLKKQLNGKPCLDQYEPRFFFNLSHSNDWVYYAVSRDPNIGIDIEYVDKSRFDEELAQFILHPEEYEQFMQLPSHHKAYFLCRHWSQKEALVKAVGIGLQHPLSEIQIDSSNCEHPSLINFQQTEDKWSLSLLETPPNYVGYLAIDKPIEKIRYCEFTDNEYV